MNTRFLPFALLSALLLSITIIYSVSSPIPRQWRILPFYTSESVLKNPTIAEWRKHQYTSEKIQLDSLNKNWSNEKLSLRKICELLATNRTVMTTFTDSGYLPIFFIFYNISRLYQYSNFFVTTMDEKAYNELNRRGIPVHLYKTMMLTNEDNERGSIITSNAFYRKVVNKLRFMIELVSLGYKTLYMDCDILLFQNPWPVLNQYDTNNADVVCQKDYTVNSGFIYLLPTFVTRKWLEAGSMVMLTKRQLDQESLIIALPRFPTLRLHLLPTHQFSSGVVFFSSHQFYWDAIQPSQYMLHNNFIVGTYYKDYRLREMKLFEEDTDGYYSSPYTQYLMVDATEAEKNNTLYLMRVAVLSLSLNRTFLLPTFPCPSSIPLKQCNLCRLERECYRRFGELIHKNYRAYSFRANPMVPADVQDAIKNGIVYTLVEGEERNRRRNSLENPILTITPSLKAADIPKAFAMYHTLRVLKLSGFSKSFPRKMCVVCCIPSSIYRNGSRL